MDSRASKVISVVLVLMLVLSPMNAHASILGEENGALATLVAQGVAEFTQAAQVLTTVQENLQTVRDVYAGVGEFLNFDPESFLEQQKQEWMGEFPIANDVSSFVTDVTSNGLRGGRFNAKDLYQKFDTYRDQARRQESQRQMGGVMAPYDSKSALTLSREAERALSNSSTRKQLAGRPEPETISEGLFASDAAKVDPKLFQLYLQRRAAAKEADYQAYKVLAESMGAAPGKAQQLAAISAGLSAQELARIDDSVGQQLSLQQLEQQQRATTKASERQQSDFLWNDIEQTAKESFKPPTRSQLDWESL